MKRILTAVALAITIVLMPMQASAKPDKPRTSSTTAPTRLPRMIVSSTPPITADGFTQMLADKNDLTWSGGDQCTSFTHNGFTYWLFGDSMLSSGEDPDGSYPDGTTMVSNRILLQTGSQLSNAIANAGSGPAGNGVLDPPTNTPENQRRYWTQGMFAANGFIYVLAAHMEKDPDPNSMGFQGKGVELAKFTQGTDGKLTLVGMIATPSTGVDDGDGPLHIQWSGDAVVDNGYVYFYGATHASPPAVARYVIHFSYVARVPVAELENPYAWRYYKRTTDTWVTSIAQLSQDPEFEHDAVIEGQVSSVRKIGNQYVMLDKPWNGWGEWVRVFTSSTPYGWTRSLEPGVQNGTNLIHSPAGTSPGGLAYQTYSPQLHPEQTLGGVDTGKVLVSIAWNSNGGGLTELMADADLYKPHFYAVTLP